MALAIDCSDSSLPQKSFRLLFGNGKFDRIIDYLFNGFTTAGIANNSLFLEVKKTGVLCRIFGFWLGF
ncbi:MAG TPA: hypothetical protein HA222_03995 [Candidatus Diapherotrites archaeon]|uniref:Uncharacterized protein n=1 Tax=Candidatus Iainarchaeum sp. TaxID=3101447 RepID=A0A7J4JYP8_9ARCH|nr:hypothetical protein [Candidatus Diapherotrites archaeon]